MVLELLIFSILPRFIQFFKRQILNSAALLTQRVPIFRISKNGDTVVNPIVLIPAGYGSFGDMAIAKAIDDLLPGRVTFVVPDDVEAWKLELENEVISLRDYTFTIAMIPDPVRFAELTNRDVVVVGADTISGAYETSYLSTRVRLLKEAANNGRVSMLTNFSFPSDPTWVSVHLLKQLDNRTAFWARDDISRRRFLEIVGYQSQVAPDIAAAMRIPCRITKNANNIAVIVPNSHFETTLHLNKAELLQRWIQTAELCAKHFEHVIITVNDIRPEVGDLQLAREIQQSLSTLGAEIELVFPHDAVHAKQIYGMAKVLVSGRMHAGVAGLSLGVATLGIEYLGKFEGQFDWYETPHVTIDADNWISCPLEEIESKLVALKAHQLSSCEANFEWGWISQVSN